MAGLSRTRSRQRDSRRADQYRLVRLAAGTGVAPADRTGLVFVLGERRSALYAGATRRRGDGVVLPGVDRRAGVAPSRSGPVLRVERRRRSARDADHQQRPRLYIWRHRNPERARCPHRRGAVVAQRRVRGQGRHADLGLHVFAAGDRRRRHRRCVRRAGRLRPRDRQAALAQPVKRRELQLAASRDDRGRRAGRVPGWARRDERRAGRRQAALGVQVGGRRHRAAGRDRRRRHPDQRHEHDGRSSAPAAFM